jgi:hypothetical protein
VLAEDETHVNLPPWVRSTWIAHGQRREVMTPGWNRRRSVLGALKAYLANSPTLTIAGRVRQVHAFFRECTAEQMLATAAPHSSPWLPEGYMRNHEQAP